MTNDPNNPKYTSYIRFLTANQKRIYGFIYAMIPNRVIAEDILQQTSLIMWEQFDDFQEKASFSAWGIGIARNLVKQYCRKQKRSFVTFDSETIDNLVDQSDVFETENDHVEALRRCFSKLRDSDQMILKMRYVQGTRVRDIAERINCTSSHLYRMMARIHNVLLQCIKIQMS